MLRRLLLLVMIFMSLPLTGCTKEILAPVVEEKIELQPFTYAVMDIPTGYTASYQQMNFYAPLNSVPQIIYRVVVTTGNPNLEIDFEPMLRYNEPCLPNCAQNAWQLRVILKPNGVGEATVYVIDKSNPSKEVSFKMIATDWGGNKG